MSEKEQPKERVRDPREQAVRELSAFVTEYRKHNNRFAKDLEERHARWEARGLLKPVHTVVLPGATK